MNNQHKRPLGQQPPSNVVAARPLAKAWERSGKPITPRRAVVTGAGGFIGSHLCKRLTSMGWWVRGVDVKPPEWEPPSVNEWLLKDLRYWDSAALALADVDVCFALAADMGGMGYIADHDADIIVNNTLINAQTARAAVEYGLDCVVYSSSACVYPERAQLDVTACDLAEAEAYPAHPDTAYGWEKLHAEHMYSYAHRDHGLGVRIARFHNIYGPLGTYKGGREKAPAALCRKVATAKLTGADHIDVWGDGQQVRSFCLVDDLVEGLLRLLDSGHTSPINLGSAESVTIDQLARAAMSAAGVDLDIQHVTGTQGVRARNSDNSMLKAVLKWEPSTSLAAGIAQTYDWIEQQVEADMRGEHSD